MASLSRLVSSPLFVPVGLLLLAVVGLFGLIAYLDYSERVKLRRTHLWKGGH